jgi:glycosyltransferase involved in cell wall biosynthesis
MADSKILPKICLNMIVKNESRVILRLLNSVIPIIDTYCICDTGSTDNTIEIIENFFKEKNITGKIIQEPFRDFGYNRSFALNECYKMKDVDYILLMDADMILTGSFLSTPDFFKSTLVDDVYLLFQGSERFFYKNSRIVRNKGYSYWGVTHEYLQTPDGTIYKNIEKSKLFIQDIGDGGAKSDKWERDIRLLRKGLEDEPNNARYSFYLANTYRDSCQNTLAIEFYKKRIEIGGWIEEIWYSYYCIGKCYQSMNDYANAVYYWLEGYQCYPNRIENIYQIINYYRNHGKNKLAYQYYLFAKRILEKYPISNDYLFLEKDVYEYKIDYEFSIIGYYENPDFISMKNLSMKLLTCSIIEDGIAKNILSNYKFYVEKAGNFKKSLPDIFLNMISKIGKSINIDRSIFFSSTPSLCVFNNQLIINTRFVNYNIDDNGNYINRENIITKNIISVIDLNNYDIISEFELKYDISLDNLYIGLEDIRLLNNNGILFYNANRGLGHSMIKVEHGIINLEEKTTNNNVLLNFILSQNAIEKNWVLFNSNNENKCIYNWYPLIIGNISNNQFIKTHEQTDIPYFFKYIRGSTNGQLIDNELWFICHLVSYESRRYYYHIIIVLDSTTLKMKKYTPFFKFESEPVEYTLGFIELSNDLLIGYSVLDRETKYMLVPKDWFKTQFIYL